MRNGECYRVQAAAAVSAAFTAHGRRVGPRRCRARLLCSHRLALGRRRIEEVHALQVRAGQGRAEQGRAERSLLSCVRRCLRPLPSATASALSLSCPLSSAPSAALSSAHQAEPHFESPSAPSHAPPGESDLRPATVTRVDVCAVSLRSLATSDVCALSSPALDATCGRQRTVGVVSAATLCEQPITLTLIATRVELVPRKCPHIT